jgi:hypothetical protein
MGGACCRGAPGSVIEPTNFSNKAGHQRQVTSDEERERLRQLRVQAAEQRIQADQQRGGVSEDRLKKMKEKEKMEAELAKQGIGAGIRAKNDYISMLT